MPITNIPANKNVGKSLGDINSNFAYLDSENEDRKKELSDKLDKSDVGTNNGIAALDSDGKVPDTQLPDYTDVIEVDSISDAPETGKSSTIYIATDTDKCYRWTGTQYSEIGKSSDISRSATNGCIQVDGDDIVVYTPVQADWDVDDSTNPAFIKNKPDISGLTAGKSAYEIAVDNGFTGTETEWLASLKGDTGRSITGITTDDNNNVIVTFSDNTKQNIGQLNIDMQADFLTSGGFGNIRYYDNKLQYRTSSESDWVDIIATTDNQLVINLAPQPMKKMTLLCDVENKCYKIVFKEPEDTIVDGQLLVAVEGIKFVRKLGSAPENVNDGTLVLDYTRRSFGKYAQKEYSDTSFTPNNGENWYYKAFPYSSAGLISNSSANVANCNFKDYYLYGFKLDQNESDPASMITYLEDCDNAYFESAYMDYTADSFNYGDWGDAWFIKKLKPCMLKYDGTVGYELDPNDYTKKLDGTASDVANTAYDGNAMIGFPKVYWKIVDNGDNTCNVYFSDKKVDDDFVCWSHVDNNGNEIDYCYMPIYTGANVSSKLRSISGLAPLNSQTRSTEITYAKANNTGSNVIWYTEVYSDRMLINLLLLLIGKSTNSQSVFGTGNNNSYSSSSSTGVKNSGTMNTKGLFWGNKDNTSGVKVFGMEHLWGNTWRSVAGCISNNGTQKIKMTYGKSDGSTAAGYNLDGTGYISVASSTPSGTSGGYIKKMLITKNVLIPITASGSASTYYCDGLWFDKTIVSYALAGSASKDASLVGALAWNVSAAASKETWSVSAAVTCKPLATT